MTLGSGTLSTGAANTSTTFSGTCTGSGSLTKVGSGEFILTGASTSYTGGTNANSGTLTVGNNTALGTGPLILNNAALQSSASGRKI